MTEERESPKASEHAHLYRENAAKARAAAEATADAAARELYLALAASWERLADSPDWFERL